MKYIGIDLGGTNIVAGLVSESGSILDKVSRPTLGERQHEEIINDMIEMCKELLSSNNLEEKDIHSIGIGVPGSADTERHIITYLCNLNFKDVHIRDYFGKHFDLPVYLGNDANVAAFGEYVAGSAKGYKSSVMVTLGTGVGGGVVENGKILTGANFNAAEIGHIVISVGGEQCGCGRKGCWEAYSSASAIVRDIKRAIENNPNSILAKLYADNDNNTNAKMAFDAKELGCPIGSEIVENYMLYLSEGLTNIISIFDPNVIILGGGVAGQKEKLTEPLKDMIRKNIFGGQLNCDIIPASLGNDAGVIGAGLLGKKA